MSEARPLEPEPQRVAEMLGFCSRGWFGAGLVFLVGGVTWDWLKQPSDLMSNLEPS